MRIITNILYYFKKDFFYILFAAALPLLIIINANTDKFILEKIEIFNLYLLL